jgi:N-acetylneuraminic acid mutarotase
LPEGRSSHDVAVVGETLYVVGGWKLQHGEGSQWHKTAWSVDLATPQLEWKQIPAPPFQRRAVSLAAWNGKLYVLGGMQEVGGITTRVAVYDPTSQEWSEGPALLGGGMDGFGTASFACGGRLFATTMSGAVQRLSADGSQWEYVGQLKHPRFFHRILPWHDELVIVGGADMSVGKILQLERLPIISGKSTEPKAAALN